MFCFNENSLHGQFQTATDFSQSMGVVFNMKRELASESLSLQVSYNFRQRPVIRAQKFDEIRKALPRDQRTSILAWISKEGPFREDNQTHKPTEYYECQETLVTETGLAEAAQLIHDEADCEGVVSLNPSDWTTTPLKVSLKESGDDFSEEVPNFVEAQQLDDHLAAIRTGVESWGDLITWAQRQCPYLLLSDELPSQLGLQFYPYISERCQVILTILNELMECVLNEKTYRLNELMSSYMMGEKALMSPSSSSELDDFKSDLTFSDPRNSKDSLYSWHGKIKRPEQYRVHFEWPLGAESKQMFIAYIGPKITKR